MSHDFIPARRRILTAAAGTTVLVSSPGFVRSAFAQPNEFKIGFFIALSGPAALFGPTQRACADLGAEKINKAGGIMSLVRKLADHVFVLHNGALVAEGSVAAIQANAAVQAIYVGAEK